MIDLGLLGFATDKERIMLEAIIEHGEQKKAAKALGVTANAVGKALRRVKKRAGVQNYTTEFGNERVLREGFTVKKTSQCRNKDGEIILDWVTSEPEKERQFDLLKEAAVALAEPIRGMAKPIKSPIKINDDFMACYVIADAHLGMYAWGDEASEDYDLDIAEKVINESMAELVESAPPTKTALIANLADYFHADNSENKTLRSGNVLDVDSRWAKVLQVGVSVYRNVINLALTKHEKVVVKSAIGNHDDHSVFCLAMMMAAYFENEPRVEIVLPINPYAYHVFGKNLIGIHHGNIKTDRLPGIMANDKPVEWGATIYRVFLGGHLHHRQVKEFPGCTVELFRSIAANDAWGHGAGYRSGRSMECIIYEADGGEHGRRVVNIS